MSKILETIVGFFLFLHLNVLKILLFVSQNKVQESVKQRFSKYGIVINGDKPWDIQVKDPIFYKNVAVNISLGLGEGYMKELWEVKDLRKCFSRILETQRKSEKSQQQKIYSKFRSYFKLLRHELVNLQSPSKAWEVGEKHYDIGNEMYQEMLGSTMNYSCGYWKNARNLDEAQMSKMKLIAAKLKLQPGMKVLEIGCGWGVLAKFLASHYQVSVTAITISKEQAAYGRKICEGLTVEIQLLDYRDLNAFKKFDRVVAVGVLEHVGPKNYQTFFDVAKRNMKDNGLFLFHNIGLGNSLIKRTDAWLDKYIFPNGALPYQTDVTKFIDGNFILEDWHNMGYHYFKTLNAWENNFDLSWPKFRDHYGDEFYRMWKYYLIFCSEAFKARKFQLWQVVLSKSGFEGGYESVR